MNIKKILQEYKIEPKKRLGQSFLINNNIANHIVATCEIGNRDIIVEVGAGFGVLTELLLKQAKHVFAIEKDPFIFTFLKQHFSEVKNLSLLNEDVLQLNLKDIVPAGSVKLVSNLPYSITSDFLYWLLDNRTHIRRCILTLQKEAAQRILAPFKTKEYCALSVLFQFYMTSKHLLSIPGRSFYPVSRVASEVIRISPQNNKKKVDNKFFNKLTKRAFSQRRKMLKNSLGLKMNIIAGINLSRRPESLNIEEFTHLANTLQQKGIIL